MHALLCLVFLVTAGILEVEAYNCTSDIYMADRVDDCFQITDPLIDSLTFPAECSLLLTALKDYDTCLNAALLGCAEHFIDDYKFRKLRHFYYDTAATECADSGLFEALGDSCGEGSEADTAALDDCLDPYLVIYEELNPVDANFCLDFGGALDDIKLCMDGVTSICSHEGMSELNYFIAHLKDEVTYLEDCTTPTDPSYNCAGQVDTAQCYTDYDDASLTITQLVPEDYCAEMIEAANTLYECVYDKTLALGCRDEYLTDMDDMATIRNEVTETCKSATCYTNQVLQTAITTTCFDDIDVHVANVDAQTFDLQSCSDFYDDIKSAISCIKDTSIENGCLFNQQVPYESVLEAEEYYAGLCGVNNETCSDKLAECEETAIQLNDSINSAVECSTQLSLLSDLDWCLTETLAVGRCTSTEAVEMVYVQEDLYDAVNSACGDEGLCTNLPYLAVKYRCIDPLQYSLEILADAIPVGQPDFCLNFEEEIGEAISECIPTQLEVAGCSADTVSNGHLLTAYYDYAKLILCNTGFAGSLAGCTSPSAVVNAVLDCGYGVKDRVADIVAEITNLNMEENCGLIDDHLADVNSCLDLIMTAQGCENQLQTLYELIEEDAFPNMSVCVATTSTTEPTTTKKSSGSGSGSGGGSGASIVTMSITWVAVTTLMAFYGSITV